MPFSPNSLSCQKNYPRNINYMPVVIFLGIPRFWKKLLFSGSLLRVFSQGPGNEGLNALRLYNEYEPKLNDF